MLLALTTALTIVLSGAGVVAAVAAPAPAPVRALHGWDAVQAVDGSRAECTVAVAPTVPAAAPSGGTSITFVIPPTVNIAVRGDEVDIATNTGMDPCQGDTFIVCTRPRSCEPAAAGLIERILDDGALP